MRDWGSCSSLDSLTAGLLDFVCIIKTSRTLIEMGSLAGNHSMAITGRFIGGTLCALLIVSCWAYPAASQSESTPQFERDVLPILTESCFQCHGQQAPMAGLDLRTPSSILRGGASGPAVVEHSAETSFLFQRISEGSMPPGKENKLSPEQIEVIGRWIDAGVPALESYEPVEVAEAPVVTEEERQFWAFRKAATVEVPPVRALERVRTPIDAFILARLEAKGLGFSQDAARRTLIRRAYFDLIGLPPSPEEVETFQSDSSPDAYEDLIDRLLASPHFGERWGRHWLDEAGHSDIVDTDVDAPVVTFAQGKWRYRDYVVRVLNEDMPYDRFLTEQLAGDELVEWRSAGKFTPEMLELLTATGFLRVAADDTRLYELNTVDIRWGVLQRTLKILTSNVLGLTVACAQCHNHKYDPIPQRDYYRLAAIFTPAYNPSEWLQPQDRLLADVSATEKEEIDHQNAEIDGQVEPWKRKLATLHRPYQRRLLEEKLVELPEPIREDLKTAVLTPSKERTAVEKYLMETLGPLVEVPGEEIQALMSEEEKTNALALEEKITPLEEQRRSYGWLDAVYDTGPPPATHLLRRGDHQTPGPEVQPGFLAVLTELGKSQTIGVDQIPTEGTSGRRLALARWLTDRESPAGALVARVRVNRLWQHLFGEGIVATSDNFGRNGAQPTHPELLNWLATEFMTTGWRVKPLLKLMMTSTVYRQASHRIGNEGEKGQDEGIAAADPNTVDPGNLLLWRMRLRRLESEVIRDAILAVSGNLDRTIGGPPVLIEGLPDGKVVVSKKDELAYSGIIPGEKIILSNSNPWRRSIYLLARRNYNLSMLSVFDQPVMSTNCIRRGRSAVVLQSLSMLNNEFVVEQAEDFARRVAKRAGEAPEARIELAFRIALGRNPTPEEVAWSSGLLQRATERFQASEAAPEEAAQKAMGRLSQMLLNTNEFLYVE